MWIKKYKKPLLWALLIAVVLAFAFWYGGGTPGSRGWTVAQSPNTKQSKILQAEEKAEPDAGVVPTGEAPPVATPPVTPEQSTAPPVTPEQSTAPPVTPEQNPAPAQTAPTVAPPAPTQAPVPAQKQPASPQVQAPVVQELSCTLSISCATAQAQGGLAAEKAALLPENGLLLSETSLSFSEGESVFDLLLRACQEGGIHLEFAKTPLYQSAYIEGIGNLYEFDCGALSGWMYQVNGSFPNYGSSRHLLQNGDVVRWVYTCDLGEDVGGGAASGQFSDT